MGCGGQESGAPCDSRWRTITAEAFEVVLVLLSLTLSNEALEDVFGPQQLRFSCRRSSFRVPVGC
jgi:hypothetical protein